MKLVLICDGDAATNAGLSLPAVMLVLPMEMTSLPEEKLYMILE